MDSHSPLLQTVTPEPLPSPDWCSVLADNPGRPVFSLGDGQTLWLGRWVLPIYMLPIEAGYILAKEGEIQSVGAFTDLPTEWQTALQERFHTVCQQGWLVSPGLINAHTHLEQSVGSVALMPNPSQPDMAAWLVAAKPKLDRLNQDADYQARVIGQGVRELINSGTTCVNDISRLGLPLEPLNRANIRGTVSLEFFHPNTETLIEPLLEPVLDGYADLQNTYAGHPFLRVGISPHSPYNVSPIAWQWMLEKAKARFGALPIIHTHLSESQAECDYLAGKPSAVDSVHQAYVGKTFPVSNPAPTPIQYMASHGLLTDKLIAAHGVYMDKEDASLLKAANVCLAHCPRSNTYLQGKTIDWPLCQSSGIPVALGTDGHLSTPGLDIRAEARIARIYHYLNATDTLRLITVNAAKVLDLEHSIGIIQEGYAADLALWKPVEAEQGLAPEEQLLSPQTQCHGTWVLGEACSLP